MEYSKTCLKRSFKKNTKIGFQDRLSLNEGRKYCRMRKSIAECSKGSILQYFRPSLGNHLSLRSAICVLFIFEWLLKTGFTEAHLTDIGPFSYATCEWPEFYVNKNMFCSVLFCSGTFL